MALGDLGLVGFEVRSDGEGCNAPKVAERCGDENTVSLESPLNFSDFDLDFWGLPFAEVSVALASSRAVSTRVDEEEDGVVNGVTGELPDNSGTGVADGFGVALEYEPEERAWVEESNE
jgi:hypothetical protein